MIHAMAQAYHMVPRSIAPAMSAGEALAPQSWVARARGQSEPQVSVVGQRPGHERRQGSGTHSVAGTARSISPRSATPQSCL